MKLFLDTSILVKLYHNEIGTNEIELFFTNNDITAIYLSEISKIEFSSTVWKKVRLKEISIDEAKITLALFETDFKKYTFIGSDGIIIKQVSVLISKYGAEGLRTLDSIQLATAVCLAVHVNVFLTADKLLNQLFEAEKLPSKIN